MLKFRRTAALMFSMLAITMVMTTAAHAKRPAPAPEPTPIVGDPTKPIDLCDTLLCY